MEKILSALEMLRSDRARRCFAGNVAAFCAITLLSTAPAALAQPTVNIKFTIIADNSDPVPGNPGATFANFSAPSIDDDGNVAFFAFSSTGDEGVYTYIGGTRDVVADQSTSIPGIGAPFPGFLLAPGQIALGSRQLSMDDGKVAFRAAIPGPGVPTGFYTNADGALEEVARGDNLPGNYAQSFTDPWLDNGKVSYSAQEIVAGGVLGDQVINTFDSTTNNTTVEISTGAPPLEGEGLDTFHNPSRGGDKVTVETSLGNKRLGILSGGLIDSVVRINVAPVPGKAGVLFSNFGHFPVLDANADIAFFGSGTDFLNGIYKRIGSTLDVVADTNTPIPGGPFLPAGSTNFGDFGTHLSIADSDVLFLGYFVAGNGTSSLGLYTDTGGVVNEIVKMHDVIAFGPDSFTVTNLAIGSEGFARTPAGYSAVFLAFLSTAIGQTPVRAIVRADLRAPFPWIIFFPAILHGAGQN